MSRKNTIVCAREVVCNAWRPDPIWGPPLGGVEESNGDPTEDDHATHGASLYRYAGEVEKCRLT